MHVALRLKGFRPGTVAASKLGRDTATVYVVDRIEDPFCYCYDGRHRRWPDRPKKKRLRHLIAIDELPNGQWETLRSSADDREVNDTLRTWLDRYHKAKG